MKIKDIYYKNFIEEIKFKIQSSQFKVPWGHNREIVAKLKNYDEAIFYICKMVQNGWSRAVLVNQIENKLYQRDRKLIINFDTKLSQPQSNLAKATLKDPYSFDFLTLSEKHNEKELKGVEL